MTTPHLKLHKRTALTARELRDQLNAITDDEALDEPVAIWTHDQHGNAIENELREVEVGGGVSLVT